MKIGLFGINIGVSSATAAMLEVAQAAEEAGFDSLWTGEHVVLPDPQAPPSPAPPGVPMLDPGIALSFLAAATSKIALGTGIIIIPQRNPLVLAKELASVDVLSGGRLLFGIGVGYLKAEFDALGIPFEDRGKRTDDYLDAIQALWTMDKPAHRGPFVSFAGVNAFPRPVQRPHPPIVVGGSTPPAFRRAVARGNGWYGFALDPGATSTSIEALRQAAKIVKRPRSLGGLEINISPPPGEVGEDLVSSYAELGVDRLILLPPQVQDVRAICNWCREIGERFGLNR